jgi:hypothetical protein
MVGFLTDGNGTLWLSKRSEMELAEYARHCDGDREIRSLFYITSSRNALYNNYSHVKLNTFEER